MVQIGEFYQIEKEDFDWVYAQVIGATTSDLKFQTVSSQEIISIPRGNQREVQLNSTIIEQLGVKEGQLKHLYILPTYHFFGVDFEGCCNPIFGYQVFPKEEYNTVSNQLNTLLEAAKNHYSYTVDLNFDREEFIRKQLICVYNVNQLFKRLLLELNTEIDGTEVLKNAELKLSVDSSPF